MKTRSVAEGIWNDYRKRLEREVEQERLVLNERCNHTPDEVISAAAHIEALHAIVGAVKGKVALRWVLRLPGM